MYKALYKIIRDILLKGKRSIVLRKYNEFTFAEYLRKQGAKVGDGCYIVPGTLCGEPYLVKIGNHVAIATGVKFIAHDGGPWIFRREIPDIQVYGPIVIEDNCAIGENAILFPNIKIGPNSIVGAGSVVISDVPPNSIVMGVPARRFGSIEKYKQKCIERWEKQKPPNSNVLPGSSQRFIKSERKKLRAHLLSVFSKELGVD